MPLKTTVSPNDAPSLQLSSHLLLPGGAIPNHELFIDLEWHMGGHRPLVLPTPLEDPGFFLSIRDVIAKSKQPGGIPIDAIHISCCTASLPDFRIWEALEEAEPTHLHLTTISMDRKCNYGGLGMVALKPGAWPLKSLYLEGVSGDGNWLEDEEDGTKQLPSFPACYAGLETLVLEDAPCSDDLYFYPEGGATNLKSLTILEGESVAVFVRTFDSNPKMAQTLKSLAIICDSQDALEVEPVRRMMRIFKEEARGLEIIELIVRDCWPSRTLEGEDYEAMHLIGLANYLPNTLTTFTFSGSANIPTLKEMDNWIEKAASPSWLPNLKKVGFEYPSYWDAASQTEEMIADLESLDEKIDRFLDLLRHRWPPVEVIEPRGSTELAQYPLPV